MRVAVIILNYCTPELTLECLASLESQVDPTVRVVVVDNASPDGSADRIAQGLMQRGFGDWATLVRSPVNGGFAAGNNLGIRSVHADAYLLLNSDTLVRPGAVAGLREALCARPDVGMIGPRLIDGDGDLDQTFFRTLQPAAELLRGANTGPLTRILKRFDPQLPTPAHEIETEWLAFAAVLIRRDVIEGVGPLDEDYFMYFEDVDYCRRVRDAGWKIMYWPHADVLHYKGASSGITDDAKLRRRAPRYYYEARSRYFTKFYGRRGLLLANALWYLGRCVSLPRELLGNARPQHREHEARDLWIPASNTRQRSRQSAASNGHAARARSRPTPAVAVLPTADDEPLVARDSNENPSEVHLLDLPLRRSETSLQAAKTGSGVF